MSGLKAVRNIKSRQQDTLDNDMINALNSYNYEDLKKAIEKGADVNARVTHTSLGRNVTPLRIAVYEHLPQKFIDLLLNNGAEISNNDVNPNENVSQPETILPQIPITNKRSASSPRNTNPFINTQQSLSLPPIPSPPMTMPMPPRGGKKYKNKTKKYKSKKYKTKKNKTIKNKRRNPIKNKTVKRKK
jgi:hypothetical protein